MRIGVYGGTFDPVHVAHVVVAAEVRHALALDEVMLVPAGDPWQKAGRVVAAKEMRTQMCELAVSGVDGVGVSRVEVDRVGASVTADTLEALGGPGVELFLILGTDAAANLPTWRRLDETRHLATVVVVEREGEHAEPPGPEWEFVRVPVPRLDISSSDLRERLATGVPVDGLVPPAVVQFIGRQGLYTPGP
ncbi:MAG: nicotinate-nucleotide adenylyltransferase [Acidimicrobiia bacterium]